MKAPYALTSLLVFAFPTPPYAQETAHPMGQHPAVLVKRQQASQGYDYQSKFYPHPAWMYLETDHHEMGDHPAVLVARRNAAAAAAAKLPVTVLARDRTTEMAAH
jgi:hypothetical protein